MRIGRDAILYDVNRGRRFRLRLSALATSSLAAAFREGRLADVDNALPRPEPPPPAPKWGSAS